VRYRGGSGRAHCGGDFRADEFSSPEKGTGNTRDCIKPNGSLDFSPGFIDYYRVIVEQVRLSLWKLC